MSWISAPFEAIQRWRTMRELRGMEKREASDFHWDFENMIEQARDVLERGNRPRAVELWKQANAMFPDLATLSDRTLDLLIRLRMFDEAEDLMNRGVRRHPRASHPLEGLALIAYRRGNLPETLSRCAVLRKAHPGSLQGYWLGAAALSELGQAEEAESLLAGGIQINPNDVGLRIERAKLAERRQDWDEALKRWTAILEKDDHASSAVGIADCLMALGRYEEADKTLADITYKWGNFLFIWFCFVRIAEHQQDWEEAVRRWGIVRYRFPMEPMCYTQCIATIEKSAHPELVDEVLRDGMERIPYEIGLWTHYAWAAHRRGDLAEAARRWATVRERFPDQPEGYQRGADVLAAAGDTEGAAKVRAMAPPAKA